MQKIIWEVNEAMYGGDQLQKLLDEGWEPYAAIEYDGTTYVQVKRIKK